MFAIVGLLMVALIWSMFSTDAGYLIWGYMMITVVTILMGAYECLDVLVNATGSCVEPALVTDAVRDNIVVTFVVYVFVQFPKAAIKRFIT